LTVCRQNLRQRGGFPPCSWLNIVDKLAATTSLRAIAQFTEFNETYYGIGKFLFIYNFDT